MWSRVTYRGKQKRNFLKKGGWSTLLPGMRYGKGKEKHVEFLRRIGDLSSPFRTSLSRAGRLYIHTYILVSSSRVQLRTTVIWEVRAEKRNEYSSFFFRSSPWAEYHLKTETLVAVTPRLPLIQGQVQDPIPVLTALLLVQLTVVTTASRLTPLTRGTLHMLRIHTNTTTMQAVLSTTVHLERVIVEDLLPEWRDIITGHGTIQVIDHLTEEPIMDLGLDPDPDPLETVTTTIDIGAGITVVTRAGKENVYSSHGVWARV